jgi:anaerobic nitric oxide reductase flavorubredoxin
MTTALREDIHWVGAVDWDCREFHSFETPHGVTYNSYLILDEKPTLIDTVKAPFAARLIQNVRSLLPLVSLRYVVCDHAEPDHSGALPALLAACPQAVVACTRSCRESLKRHYDTTNWKFEVVSSSQPLSLGRHTLQFIETPLLHWPDSTFAYLPSAEVLFSMDAFGQHYASSGRFDDEIDLGMVLYEAQSYYANIVAPYAKQAQDNLKKLASLKVGLIAPSHGIIWREQIPDILAHYQSWAANKPRPKVVVAYDTMWGGTGEMAQQIADGAVAEGVEVHCLSIRRAGLTRLATELLDSAALALGTPTLNQGMMPQVAAALAYLKGLRFANKAAFAFGTFGWGKGGAEGAEEQLQALGYEILRPVLRAQYRPTPEVLGECREAGKLLAERAAKAAQG